MMNYPMPFNPYLMNSMPQQPQQPAQQNIISMQSEDDAINYPVAPGNNIIIFIEGTRIVYEKIGASQFDKPIIRRYELVEKPLETQNTHESYVLASDFEAFKNHVCGFISRFEEGGEDE